VLSAMPFPATAGSKHRKAIAVPHVLDEPVAAVFENEIARRQARIHQHPVAPQDINNVHLPVDIHIPVGIHGADDPAKQDRNNKA
jgi:hypothetical protein